jgi:subtilisin family serine protease
MESSWLSYSRPRSDFLVILPRELIPSTDVGTLVAPQTLVVPEDKLAAFLQQSTFVYNNSEIDFALDPPGGVATADNDDNWGAAPAGYNAKRFWDLGLAGRGIRIGIADSGIDISHSTFSNLISDSRLISFAAFAADGSKIVQHAADGSVVPDTKATPTFTHWHGTFCSAVLVGQPTDGKLRGIAPNAELSVAQVLQQGSIGTVASILAGLTWLADQRCDVVSLSLAWDGKHDEWAQPIRTLIDQGSVVVAAIGNSFGTPGVPPSSSPGNYPISNDASLAGMLLSVGAIDINNRVGDFSGGETVDWSAVVNHLPDGTTTPSTFATSPPQLVPEMVAAGVEVVSANAHPTLLYRLENGTSMAAPQVAGLVALVLQKLRENDPSATPRKAAQLLLDSLVPIGPGGTVPDRSGRGKVDIDMLLRSFPGGS